jgi:hypothetical protein
MPGPLVGKCASPAGGPGILLLGLASNERLGVNAHKFATRVWARYLSSACLEVFDMHFDGLMNKRRNFLSGARSRYAARKVGNVRAEAAWPLFYDNEILHE